MFADGECWPSTLLGKFGISVRVTEQGLCPRINSRNYSHYKEHFPNFVSYIFGSWTGHMIDSLGVAYVDEARVFTVI